MKYPPLSLVFFLTLLGNAVEIRSQRLLGNNRRQAVINEWIRTIREAPKGHSMSPSWTSKARPQVIGVGELPLQNEAVPVQPQVPNRLFKNSQSPIQSNRFKRYPDNQGFSRPRGVGDLFKQNKPLSRYQEINTDFKPLRPKKSPQVPKLDLDLTPKRPKLDLPKLDLPKSDLPSFPSLRPFSEDGFSFGQVSRPPLKRKDPKFAYVDTKPLKVPEEKPEDLYNLEKRPFRPEPQPEVELTRPKRRKPASPTAFQSSPFNPEFNFGNGPEFPEPQPEVELTRPKRRRPASAFESEPFKPEFNFGNVPEFPDLTQTVQRPGRQVFNRFEESARPNFNRFEEQSRPEFNRIESSRPEFGRPGFEETPRQILNSQRPGFNRFSDSNFPELSRFEESAKRFRNSARAPEFEEASRPGPPYVEDLDFNQVEKPQTRLKRKFPFKERPKTLTERPSRVRKRFPDERLKFRGLPARSYFEDRNSVGTGVYRTTTPRPIPTPGPNDFPRPPPHLLRPRPPPTHPTHPPLVTHPPEHYETVTRLPPSLNEIPQTKLTEITEYDDDDTFDDNQDEGFFAYPGSFPSLADLGAGFESMKIRRRSGRSTRAKRSLDERDPLMTSEARRRRRIRRPGNRRGIVDNRRYRRNQANQNRQGQGFRFQETFWDDISNDEFFNNFQDYNRNPNRPRNYDATPNYETSGPNYETSSGPNYYGQRNRDPYTEQTIQVVPVDNNDYYNTNDPYSGYQRGAINNEILGSGNFEVIKGGTFYDADTYYYSTYNRRPQYGEELFENFRDFADIKNDRYRYPKYR